MKNGLLKFCLMVLFIFSFAALFPSLAHADPPDELDYHEAYNRATVLQILNEGVKSESGTKIYSENLKVQFIEGQEKGKIITVSYSNDARFGTIQRITQGSLVIIDSKPDPNGKMFYVLYEPYRLTNLWWILGAFILFALVVIGKKGISALAGLGISILVILLYIMPQILKGH